MRTPGFHIACFLGIILLLFLSCGSRQDQSVLSKDVPVESKGNWIQPNGPSAPLIWGHKDGIRVGLPPMPGPRGLIRVYAPYLGHKEDKMINFIALEPIVQGENQRGFSELEQSFVDGKKGKLFISSNHPDEINFSQAGQFASGVIKVQKGIETLTLYVHSEPFGNGAKPYVRVRFYSDKPYEIELTTFTQAGSAPLDHCILTATMGNYARLRDLFLEDTTLSSLAIWPEYNDVHFTDHHSVPSEQMLRGADGAVYFVAASNERDLSKVTYAENTNDHWRYYGKNATQYWRVDHPAKPFYGLVNGRYAYWASKAPIPGGISYENFELKRPFKNGQVAVFGVSPLKPEVFVKQITE